MLSIVATNVATNIINPEIILKNGYFIANNLLSSVLYLKTLSHTDNELKELMTNTDILEDIGIIKTFIEEKKLKTDSLSVQVCIDNLNQTLITLEENINSITSKIENHKKLWFNSFRSYDIQSEKTQIPKLVKQMKHRFEILIKISSVI
jgi:phenylalanyl-tRNA synthetase alpha subunit